MNSLSWILLGVVAAVIVTLGVVLARALRTVASLRSHVAELEQRMAMAENSLDELGPLLADTRSALRQAENRNIRADDLVLAATGVTARADAASKLAYEVATSPVVRVLALGRGVRRGVGALRSGGADSRLELTSRPKRRSDELVVPEHPRRSARRR